MPFDVISKIENGEIHYICSPHNSEQIFFEVNAYVHNSIRLILDVYPQKHGAYILNDMASAPEGKKQLFVEYYKMIKDEGAKISLLVNNSAVDPINYWPEKWRSFLCKITKVPIPESEDDDLETMQYWLDLSFNLVFSLLNIVDVDNQDTLPIQSEGTPEEIRSIKYERNPFNRKLCLKKKGYCCSVCGMNFEETYGSIGKDFIEIHHTTPVSVMGKDYILNIDTDLYPLCSNCHSMIHRTNPPLDIQSLRAIHQERNYGSYVTAAEPVVSYNIPSPSNNLIVGVIRPERLSPFLQKKAKSYYFGKRFPSTYNLKHIQYFAPYYSGGIRGYYDVLAVRTVRKSEIDSETNDPNDLRIVLELGDYHHVSDSPRSIKLLYHSYSFIKLSEFDNSK